MRGLALAAVAAVGMAGTGEADVIRFDFYTGDVPFVTPKKDPVYPDTRSAHVILKINDEHPLFRGFKYQKFDYGETYDGVWDLYPAPSNLWDERSPLMLETADFDSGPVKVSLSLNRAYELLSYQILWMPISSYWYESISPSGSTLLSNYFHTENSVSVQFYAGSEAPVITSSVSPIPIPAAGLLAAAGLGSLALLRGRRRG